MSSQAREVLHHVLELLGGRLAAQVILLVSALILPRLMGAESFGHYAAWMAMIAIARMASTLGLTMVEVRFLPPLWRGERKEDALELGSTILSARAVLSVLFGLALGGWMLFTPRLALNGGIVLLLAALAVALFLQESVLSLLLPFGKIGSLSLLLSLRAALTLAAVALGFMLRGLPGVLGALVGLNVALLVLTWWVLRSTVPLSLARIRWSSLTSHLPFSLSVYVGSLSWVLQSQIAIYAVANWATRVEAAYLGLTIQVYTFVQLLYFSTRRALMPTLATIVAEGELARLGRWVETLMRYSVAAASLLTLGWAFLGDHFLRLTLGEAFVSVHPSATLILFCLNFFVLGDGCNTVLYLRGRGGLASSTLLLYTALTVAGLVWALRGESDGTAQLVAWCFALAAVAFFAVAWTLLRASGGPTVNCLRPLLLALPSLLAVVPFVVPLSWTGRVAALVSVLVLYALAAVAARQLPWQEIRQLPLLLRGSLTKESTPADPFAAA